MPKWTVYGIRLTKPGARLNGQIVYVGYTRQELRNRLRGHRYDASWRDNILEAAIRKHDAQAFTIEALISDIATIEEAKMIETTTIAERGTFGRRGYNSTRGGDGPHSDSPAYRVPFMKAMKARGREGSAWRESCKRGQRERWHRQEEREKQSTMLKHLHQRPDYRAAHKVRMRERAAKPEFRAGQRERTLQLRTDPDYLRRDAFGRAKRWAAHWRRKGDVAKAEEWERKAAALA